MNDSASAVTAHLEWLHQRGLSPATICYRRRVLTNLTGHLPVPLLDATAADLARWRAGLGQAPATVLHLVSHARSFYDWALGQRLVGVNPAAGLPVPSVRRGLPRPIAEDDLMFALDAAPDRIRPWLVLAGWCGLRAQEIAWLRAEDILDRASPPVLLVSAYAAKGRRERVVPLSPFVLAELAAVDRPGRGWMFRRCDGKPGPNAPWVVSQLCGAHLRELGIPATLHSLRHRFGTRAYQASRDLLAVQSLMGHADPATTAVYAKYADASASAAVAGIPVPRMYSDDGPPVPDPADAPEVAPGWAAPVVPLRAAPPGAGDAGGPGGTSA